VLQFWVFTKGQKPPHQILKTVKNDQSLIVLTGMKIFVPVILLQNER